VTCSFRGQTRPSASEVSPSRLLSSGTHFHNHDHTSVAGIVPIEAADSPSQTRLIICHVNHMNLQIACEFKGNK